MINFGFCFKKGSLDQRNDQGMDRIRIFNVD